MLKQLQIDWKWSTIECNLVQPNSTSSEQMVHCISRVECAASLVYSDDRNLRHKKRLGFAHFDSELWRHFVCSLEIAKRVLNNRGRVYLGIWEKEIRGKNHIDLSEHINCCTYSGDLNVIQTFWRSDFKWLGFRYGYSNSPNHSKTGHFCPNFKWFLTKWQPFVRISDGWASGFQIAFKIQTICNPTCFGPFKIQTRSDFRSPLFTWKPNFKLMLLFKERSLH